MSEEIKKILDECNCSDYDLCLKYLQRCFPNLEIDAIYQEYLELMGNREEFIKAAKECLLEGENNE